MALFRKTLSPYQTALAMIGAQAGSRVLVAGTPAPALVAELAGVTGLNGRTLLVVEPEARPSYDKAAAQAGVLLETLEPPQGALTLPPTDEDHDVVVLQHDLARLDEATRQAAVTAGMGAVRPGGRVLIIEGRPSSGWFGHAAEALPASEVLALLETAGGLAVRQLESTDGIGYFEARKGR